MNQQYRRIRRGLGHFFKGVVVGVANIIPGVSGGTIAVTLGIYDRLVIAVNALLSRSRDVLPEVPFLGAVAAGVLAGVFLFAGSFERVYSSYPVEVAFLFMGLILGGLGPLWHTASRHRIRPLHSLPFLLALAAALSLLLVTPTRLGAELPELSAGVSLLLIASGAAAAAAMVVPGISGSLILVLLGTYGPILHAVGNRNLVALGLVMIGVVFGGITITRLMAILLKRAPAATYSAIIGLVLGSVPRLFPGFPEGATLVAAIAAFSLGFAAAIILVPRERRRAAVTTPQQGR